MSPVSYTHLDVYKRQHTHTHTHTHVCVYVYMRHISLLILFTIKSQDVLNFFEVICTIRFFSVLRCIHCGLRDLHCCENDSRNQRTG